MARLRCALSSGGASLCVRSRSRPRSSRSFERHFELGWRQRDPEAAHAQLWTLHRGAAWVLVRGHGARAEQSRTSNKRLWPWSRISAWRYIKFVMRLAGVIGCQACPRGLSTPLASAHHKAGVPLNLIQRWMGHSRISSTAIYADPRGNRLRRALLGPRITCCSVRRGLRSFMDSGLTVTNLDNVRRNNGAPDSGPNSR